MYKKGGFPDLTGDGKITRADILKGRGVFKSGGMKDPNPGITALRKEAPEVVAKMGYGMGGMKDMYQAGGLLNASKQDQIAKANQLYKQQQLLTPKSRFQSGGMYGDNQIPAGLGSTAMSMYQESDPRLQEQREQSLAAEEEKLTAGAAQMKQEIEGDKAQDEATLLQNQQQRDAKSQALGSGVKKAGEFIGDQMYGKPQTDPVTGEAKKDGLGNLIVDSKISDFDPSLIKSGKGLYGLDSAAPKGTQAIVNPVTGAEGSLAPGGTVPTGWEVKGVSGGNKLSTGLSKMSSGLKSFGAKHAGSTMGKAGSWMSKGVTGGSGTLASMATPAMISTLAGAGIKKLSDDNDPTKSNFGEYAGSTLSAAGTGAQLGSMIMPGVGTAVGAIGGALYGAGKQFFGTKAAKKEKEKIEAERREKVGKFNKELTESYGMQKGQLRAGNLRQKTYSGYDLGRNVIAQMGGMRMGTPRYGY